MHIILLSEIKDYKTKFNDTSLIIMYLKLMVKNVLTLAFNSLYFKIKNILQDLETPSGIPMICKNQALVGCFMSSSKLRIIQRF